MNKNSMFALTGKRILITGASSGLGAHFARLTSEHGARVALAARRQDRTAALQREIESAGGEAVVVTMDVRDESSTVSAIRTCETELGGIDVLINNAGIAITREFLNTDRDQWQDLVDTNLIGLASVARHVAKAMAASGRGGAIINVGSILGVRAGIMASAYAATKAGVIHLSRGMAIELARYDIRVNCLLPAYIETELEGMKDNPQAVERMVQRIPQRRIGKAEDLDGAILLLASDASSYMTGSTITVDGGHSVNSL